MELIQGSETSENYILTPGIYPKEHIHYSKHGESLKSKKRKRLSYLDRANWTIGISWVKAHAGTYGNKMADQLAKAARQNSDIAVSFNRIPTRTLHSELKKVVIQK
jgi:ribonuclease HI